MPLIHANIAENVTLALHGTSEALAAAWGKSIKIPPHGWGAIELPDGLKVVGIQIGNDAMWYWDEHDAIKEALQAADEPDY